MGRFIFIFSIIIAYFFTIVSWSVRGMDVNEFSNFQPTARIVVDKSGIPVFSDGFETGSLSGWVSAGGWEVSANGKIFGNFSLKHLSGGQAGNSSIFHQVRTNIDTDSTRWIFTIKNGDWDPSSSNRFWFFLCADTTVADIANGWAVGTNISGSNDLLELWRVRKGKADSLIIRTDLDWDASMQTTIQASRSPRGEWKLTYLQQGKPRGKMFAGVDLAVSTFKYVGLVFHYTSTRAGQLWMDDVAVSQSIAGPFVKQLLLVEPNVLRVFFSKPVNPASVRPSYFKLTDGDGGEISVNQAVVPDKSATSVDVRFASFSGTELRLSVFGVTDRDGIPMLAETRSISYSFPPKRGTVIINEILFNPYSGGADFVELVNISGETIAAHRLMLAARDGESALKQVTKISDSKRFMKPNSFLVCTKDPANIESKYFTCNPATFCTMKSMPSYPDDLGTVVLLNDSLEILDEFSYSAKMHSPFFADKEGISLERISFDKPTGDPSNWTSAAASIGYASPGLPNSQAKDDAAVTDKIFAEPNVFSPNGDGYNDQLVIQFSFDRPGYIANVRVFDAVGRQVRLLVTNQLLAQQGSWLWDGNDDQFRKASIGVYIILTEVFDPEGNLKHFKTTCTLTDRLD